MPKENLEKSQNNGKTDDTATPALVSSEKLKNLNEGEIAPSTEAALAEVAGKMSPPNPDALAAKPPLEAEPETNEGFNPEIHEVGQDNKPILTPTGRFKKKKGIGAARRVHVPESESAEVKRAEMEAAQRKMAASVVVDSFINTGIMVFGPEWQPETQEIKDPNTQKVLGVLSERDTLIITTEQYMAAKGIKDIPPGVCLALVISAYCLKRAQKPETQKRLIAIFGGFRAKLAGLFGKIKGMIARSKK